MFNFIFGKKKFLGIDIGTSAIKMAELEIRGGKPYLSNYAWMPVPDTVKKNTGNDSIFLQTSVPQYLKKIISETKLGKSNVYMAIPAFGGLITLIDFPRMPEEEMEQAIKFEAHKYIPTSLDEVTISWEVVGENSFDKRDKNKPSQEEKTKVLLVAASKNKVITYEKVAKTAGLELKGVEIESISMVESLVGKDKGNFIIVDIGYRTCNIVYVEGGIIKMNRNIEAGGDDITQTIAKGMGISRIRAESMKKSEENFFSAKSSVRFSSLDIIVGEITRMTDVLSGRGSAKIDSLMLSGGTSNMKGIIDFFHEKTGLKVINGNPFGRIDYDKRLSKSLDRVKGMFSVCVGLALKGVNDDESRK